MPRPLTWWQSEIGDIAPVGHALRHFLQSRWTRFHSLPDLKRYAETDEEKNEIVSRHLTITNIIFRKSAQIYVYRSQLYEKRLRGKFKHQLASRQLQEVVVKLPVHLIAEPTHDENIMSVRALTTTWQPDFFLDLLSQIAQDQESGVAFVEPESKNIYCPYDGGMDVFTFSMNARELALQFSHWQSPRLDKL